MKTITRTLLAATLVACAPLALAQGAADYPSRTVRVLVPNSPGGPVDTVGRLTAAFLESRFKQPFVVENRQGANSRIATEAMVKSAPDGYTLLVSPPQLYVFEQMTNKEWPFRYERDYTVVSWIAGAGYAIVAANNFAPNNMRELVAWTRANPGKANEGQPAGFNVDFAILRHQMKMGEVTLIRYGGAVPAMQAVMSGDVQYVGTTVLTAMPLEKAGKLKIIAYTGRTRHPLIPQVPTVVESGTDHESGLVITLLAPAGMPADLTNKISAAVSEMTKNADVVAKLNAIGQLPHGLNPAQSLTSLNALAKTYSDAIASGVKMNW